MQVQVKNPLASHVSAWLDTFPFLRVHKWTMNPLLHGLVWVKTLAP